MNEEETRSMVIMGQMKFAVNLEEKLIFLYVKSYVGLSTWYQNIKNLVNNYLKEDFQEYDIDNIPECEIRQIYTSEMFDDLTDDQSVAVIEIGEGTEPYWRNSVKNSTENFLVRQTIKSIEKYLRYRLSL